MLIAGIDEAGRGPVLGPLVIAGVIMNEDDLERLVALGLTDSKLLSRAKRETLFDEIISVAKDYHVVKIQAEEIDNMRNSGTNLNQIELRAIIDILNILPNWSHAFVDACDPNDSKFELLLKNEIPKNITAEHCADLTYPIVSAASIIAKVTRDKEIDLAQKDHTADIGSGYPNDPKTIQFLVDYYKENSEMPKIARKTWETAKKIIEDSKQTNIDSFFNNE